MSDRTSYYPELAKNIAPAEGEARRLPPRPRGGLDDPHRRRLADQQGARPAVRLAHADAEDPPRQAHEPAVRSDQGARAAGRAERPRLRSLGHLSGQRLRGGAGRRSASARDAGAGPRGAGGGRALAGRLRPRLRPQPRRQARQERRDQDAPGAGAHAGHGGLPLLAAPRPRGRGLVRLDGGLPPGRSDAPDARRVREGAGEERAGDLPLDDLRLRGALFAAFPSPTARRTSAWTSRPWSSSRRRRTCRSRARTSRRARR